MRTTSANAVLLGGCVGLTVVCAAQTVGLQRRTPQEPIPIAGHIETCAAAAPIVAQRLSQWGLQGTVDSSTHVRFDGALAGPSAPFAFRNFDVLMAAPGRVTATDPSGRVRLEGDDLAGATFTVGFIGAVTLNLMPTAAAHARLAAEAGPEGVQALVWHRDGERVGTSAPGLPAPGEPFDIPAEPRQAAVTKSLANSRALPCPAVVVLAR